MPSDLRVTPRRKLIRASHRHRLCVIVDFSKGLSCFLPSKHLGSRKERSVHNLVGTSRTQSPGPCVHLLRLHQAGPGASEPPGRWWPRSAPSHRPGRGLLQGGGFGAGVGVGWAGPPSGFRHLESPSLASSFFSSKGVQRRAWSWEKLGEQEAQCGRADRGAGERQQGLEGARRKEPGEKGQRPVQKPEGEEESG